ncbi:hypothetical protein PENTCL1PPCAC_6185 [Pristionchus entomophagus]|uniref:G-protein coupled receptors family 1 profile domain-containing protein n=1 Tax=Pristionchus entomophagus TaxID=358040 RepID=A0AAV5SN84_9BILA|nr:hypothetical protein PENTCL1PPCAC_6185 [Pristionchus entomophagus]
MLYKPISSVEKDVAAYLEDLKDQVIINQSLIYVGAVCAFINLPLLFIFLTYRPFRGRFQLLITLAFADFINCLSIMAQGIQRSSIFIDVISTSLMPIKSPFDCVGELWLMMREIGGLWAPMIQIIMGSERILAVFKPAWYNRTYHTRSIASVLFSIFFVVSSISSAIIVAWTKRESKVRYYCGRKAAFTANYGTYVYLVNVGGYSIGFLLNLISYCKVHTFMNRTEKNKNLARLRYYLVISAMSTVLVSIPNFINLASVLFDRIADEVSKAANWTTAINSGMNFFVFLALNEEFRNRCKQIVNALMGMDSTGKVSMIEAKTVMGSSQAKVSAITVKTKA